MKRQGLVALGSAKGSLMALGGSFLLPRAVALLLAWPFVEPCMTPLLPDSEWAYEDTGIRELQDRGLTGEGYQFVSRYGNEYTPSRSIGNNLAGFRDFFDEENQEVRVQNSMAP